ncbi:Protein disulfide-isomerase MPD1 [Nakaseomyces bracarensis]|uniref:Protein disulfide-isomerase MPD1 n=1 Tax=Nakaseomyces bracarensis TaxID=273131 RepID=A0ABR4NRR0_9SACH
MLLYVWLCCAISLVSGQLQSFYGSDPNIIELSTANFDRVVHNTNYTTLVEFYAPWCGYCKQLKNTIHQLGKVSDGVYQVAAVNCDLEKNKQLCSQYGVQGFPTLMVFKPPKKGSNLKKHAQETYQGERKLAPLADFIKSRVKRYVKKIVKLDNLNKMLQQSPQYSVVLFSKKDAISPLYKSIALDWLGQLKLFMFPLSQVNFDTATSLQNDYPGIHKQLNDALSKEKSVLVVFDSKNDVAHILSDKITKATAAKFIMDSTSIKPREGPYSKRDEYLNKLKKKKKTTVQDDEF